MAKEKNEEKKLTEEIKEAVEEKVEDAKDAVEEKVEDAKNAVEEKVEDTKDAVEEKVEDAKNAVEEKAEEAEEAVEEAAGEPARLSSTEAKRKKKAERREAKAARKEANKVEEKKKRPNNLVLTILIFGVLIGMFVFVGAYNYFSKPATIEKYMKDNGLTESYKDAAFSEHTKMNMTADKNAIDMVLTVDEDAPEEEIEQYTGDEGTKTIKQWGAYFLTSMKPQTRALSANVSVKVKQGDKELNSVDLTYSEAKKVMKEAEEEAKKETEETEDADDAADEADGAADKTDDAADEADDAADEADEASDEAEAEGEAETEAGN